MAGLRAVSVLRQNKALVKSISLESKTLLTENALVVFHNDYSSLIFPRATRGSFLEPWENSTMGTL